MLCPPRKSQGNIFTFALLRVIGSSATTITTCHSEITNRKMTQSFQLFHGSLKNQLQKFPTPTWSVLKVLPGYSSISKACLLCLNKKLLTAAYADPKQLLNKRS